MDQIPATCAKGFLVPFYLPERLLLGFLAEGFQELCDLELPGG